MQRRQDTTVQGCRPDETDVTPLPYGTCSSVAIFTAAAAAFEARSQFERHRGFIIRAGQRTR
ncbi:MAG TPA: hypothetical protein VHT52_00795 [Stellaceae bacterium]|nr:hypothetical protein [Stellaceae bacterium]